MNYTQTLEYLYSRLPMYHRVGGQAYKSDLTNTLAISSLLGNPEKAFRSVHVGGTNGKGSVSHMLASVFQAAGYKTGLYTSPHLKDFRERIRVNGKMIPARQVTRFVQKHKKAMEKIGPSFFEWTVGLAFDHFRREQTDIAIVEVGLGGRLDSTNIILPELSVITNISFDHMQFLGTTLESIAREKAGIIKPGIPVVIGETEEPSASVFKQAARENGSSIIFADQCYRLIEEELTGQLLLSRRMKMEGACGRGEIELDVPLAGIYQVKNVKTVLASCGILEKAGFRLHDETIITGVRDVVKNTNLKGRWQVLRRKPLTICDTGHNEAGIKEILLQIGQTPHENLHMVFGVVNDKELEPIFSLLPRDATYYFCKPSIPRGLDSLILRKLAENAGLSGNHFPTVAAALEAASQVAGIRDMIFVGGSTFVAAEVI